MCFMSGFRNYLGKELLKEGPGGSIKKPAGNVIISAMPKLIDCPDIAEYLIHLWSVDVFDKLNNEKKRKNMKYLTDKAKEFILKLYPVVYSDKF